MTKLHHVTSQKSEDLKATDVSDEPAASVQQWLHITENGKVKA